MELGRLAEGGRIDRQRIHKGLSAWPLAGALLLPVGLAGWVAAAVYVHAWARGIRITRWKWIGSWGIVTLSALAASGVFRAVNGDILDPSGSGRAFLAVIASLATFLVTEATGFFLISRLNDPEDERYLRAQLASPSFYVVELAVLGSGALAAVLYGYWPGFLALGGPALLLMQRGLLHQPLQHEARHDAKTGVLNCEAWRATASSAMGHARREEQLVAVAVVDIDHFKTVNDVFGHLAGDDVLARTADAIVGCVRSTDLVGPVRRRRVLRPPVLRRARRRPGHRRADPAADRAARLLRSPARGHGVGRTGHRAGRRRRRERRPARAHGRRRPGPLPGQARWPEPGRRDRHPPAPGAAVRQLSPGVGAGPTLGMGRLP